MKRSEYKYTAFISYRHVEPDASIAAALHKAIETFKVPREFYEDGKPPVFRVFRDREELSASDLSDSIQDALDNSFFLIVISSLRTPDSEWCTREVEYFRQRHGDERIISVLIEGEPHQSFSQPLLELQKIIIDEAGQEQLAPRELLAADLRPDDIKGSFVGYEALQQADPAKAKDYQRQALKLLKTEIYRIMAAILGCTLGDLKQRAKERRQRQIVRVSAFFAVLFLAFGLFMFRAYRQENIARREALQTNSALLLNRSQELLSQGDKIKSLLVARQAMNSLDEAMDKYPALRRQHESILSEALFPVASSIRTRLETGNSLTYMALRPQGDILAVGLGNDGVGLFDSSSGQLLNKLSGHREQVKIVNFSDDGRYLLSAGYDNQVILWDVAQAKALKVIEHAGSPMMARFFGDDEFFLVFFGREMMLYRYRLTADTVDSLELEPSSASAKYDPATQELLVLSNPSAGDQLKRYDFKTGRWLDNYPLPDKPDNEFNRFHMIEWSNDNQSIYAGRGGTLYKISRADGSVIFQVDNSSFSQGVKLEESSDGQRLYLVNNSVIQGRDAQTGQLLQETVFNGIISHIKYHPESNTLAVALENGRVALWRDDLTIDSGVDLAGALASEMLFSPDGERVYVNAQASREVFYIDVTARHTDQPINGQVVATSPLGSYSLMYNSNNFFIWDNQAKAEKQALDTGLIEYNPSYILDDLRLAISEDGQKIAFFHYEIENNQRTDYISIVSSQTGQEWQFELADRIESNDLQMLFHPETNHLILAFNRKVQAWDVSGELVWEHATTGFSHRMVLSQDGKQLGLSFFEGNAQIIDLISRSVIRDLPGQVVWLQADVARGIYNNSAYQADGDEITYHDLDKRLDNTPVSQYDQMVYHEPSDQLLIIRNGPDRPVAYLFRYSSGQLLRQFNLALTSYKAKGFFQQDGELVMDQSFHSTLGRADDMKLYRAYTQSLRFHFAPYGDMLGQEEVFLGDRSLSDQERTELGLDQ